MVLMKSILSREHYHYVPTIRSEYDIPFQVRKVFLWFVSKSPTKLSRHAGLVSVFINVANDFWSHGNYPLF